MSFLIAWKLYEAHATVMKQCVSLYAQVPMTCLFIKLMGLIVDWGREIMIRNGRDIAISSQSSHVTDMILTIIIVNDTPRSLTSFYVTAMKTKEEKSGLKGSEVPNWQLTLQHQLLVHQGMISSPSLASYC